MKIKILFIFLISFFISGCFFNEDERELISLGLSPKGMYLLAQDEISGGAVDEAIKILNQIQAAYPSSKYAIQSRLDVAYQLFKRDRYDESIDSINAFLKLYPDHFSTPYALFLRGLNAESRSKSILDEFNITDNAQRDVGSVKEALNYYLDLIKKYPNNKYSDEAKSKMVSLRNILSRHELFIAIFYTNNKSHIAAINRCKTIIEKYPNTPSVPAALHLIALNYDKINAPKLAEDARRVLKASYPKYIPHYSLEN